jgi:RNA polymerase sigma-70 factor (ECF subfamily)
MSAPQAPAPQLADLEALYDAHHRQAIGLAYRLLGDLGDAEEAVQEVFLSAWRSGHTYDPARGSTHTWILSMVRNRCIDVLRARKRRPVQPLAEGLDPPDTSDVPAEAVSNVDAAAARLALEALPPEQKQAIELAYFAGLSHSEIATQLAAPIGTVKGRIRLGLDRLRTSMGVQLDPLSAS